MIKGRLVPQVLQFLAETLKVRRRQFTINAGNSRDYECLGSHIPSNLRMVPIISFDTLVMVTAAPKRADGVTDMGSTLA